MKIRNNKFASSPLINCVCILVLFVVVGEAKKTLGKTLEKKPVEIQLSEVDIRITKVEEKLDQFLKKPGLTIQQKERDDELKQISNDLHETAFKLASKEIEVSSHFMQFIGIVLALMAIVIPGVSYIMKMYLEHKLNAHLEKELNEKITIAKNNLEKELNEKITIAKNNLEKELNEKITIALDEIKTQVTTGQKELNNKISSGYDSINRRMNFLSSFSLVTFYFELSYTCWEIYAPFLNTAQSKEDSKTFEQISSGKIFAEKGLAIYKNDEFTKSLESEPEGVEALTKKGHLINDYIYHATMEVAISNQFDWEKIDIDQAQRDNILNLSKECLELSEEEEFNDFKFNFQESIYFSWVMLGSSVERKKGIESVENIITNATTSSTQFWSQETWDRWTDVYKVTLSIERPI